MIQKELNIAFPELDLLCPRVPVPFFVERDLVGYLLPDYLARIYWDVDAKQAPVRTSEGNFYHYMVILKDLLDAYLEPQQKKKWLTKLRKVYRTRRGRVRRSKVPPLYVWMPITYAQENQFAILYNPFNTVAHLNRQADRNKRLRTAASELRALRKMEDNQASLDAEKRARAGRPFNSRPRTGYRRGKGGGTVRGEERKTPSPSTE